MSAIRSLVERVATSIAAEVTGATTWTIERFDPMARLPDKGKVLSVYATRTLPGDFETTGSVEDVHEIVVEYTEPAGDQADTLQRDEAGELAAYDTAASLRAWALNHPAFGDIGIHRFNLTGIDYMPAVRREAFVRYCRLTFNGRSVSSYG